MDTQRDFEPFRELVDQLCATWNRPSTDAVVQAYWLSLKDARLAEVRGNIQRILRTAHAKQPFPKPAELRDAPPKELAPSDDAKFRAAEEFSRQSWDEFFRDDPKLASLEFGYARACRIMATERESSPQYAQAKKESRHYSDLRMRLLVERLDKAIAP